MAQVSRFQPQRRPPVPAGPYLVLGLARAGRAAAKTLAGLHGGHSVRVWDDAPAAREKAPPGLQFADANADRALSSVRTVIKSPGVRVDHELVVQARNRGIPVIDELEFGWRLAAHPTVAVTGTNGKSTTAALIAAALRADGHGAALAGNVESVQGGVPLCTLSPTYTGWVVAEVSSYQAVGLAQMLPDVAVFTNLTPDHLHWHGSMQAYGQAKRRVFTDGSRCAGLAVVNVDDAFGAQLADDLRALGGNVLAYGWATRADYRIEACEWDGGRSRILVSTPSGPVRLHTDLPGTHNAANVTAAIAAADGIGLERQSTLPAIASTSAPPGRMERIDSGRSFDLFVDFAHSVDSIERVLSTLRGLARQRGGRLIAVVGLPIGAAPTRRECGRVARQGCDELILDAWSLRGEPPLVSLAALLAGAREVDGARLRTALCRRAGIARALSLARAGDVVAILGRGPLQTIAWDRHAARVPFDDRDVTRELLLSNELCEREAGRAAPAPVA